MAALIASLADGYDAILKTAATTGKNVMPRVAALLDVMQISEIVAVQAPDTFVRPIYAGNAMQTVKSNDAKKIITVRATAFKAAEEGGSASVEKVDATDDPALSEFVGEELTKSDRPELTGAKIVISGGRALASYENFEQYIFPIADKLGAAVGASRAADAVQPGDPERGVAAGAVGGREAVGDLLEQPDARVPGVSCVAAHSAGHQRSELQRRLLRERIVLGAVGILDRSLQRDDGALEVG